MLLQTSDNSIRKTRKYLNHNHTLAITSIYKNITAINAEITVPTELWTQNMTAMEESLFLQKKFN